MAKNQQNQYPMPMLPTTAMMAKNQQNPNPVEKITTGALTLLSESLKAQKPTLKPGYLIFTYDSKSQS